MGTVKTLVAALLLLASSTAAEGRMMVSKTEKRMDVMIQEGSSNDWVGYPFTLRYRDYKQGRYPDYMDNWGIGPVELKHFDGERFTKEADLFFVGEAEMAINVTSEHPDGKPRYVGGVAHGFENIIVENGKRLISISIDGVEVAENATVSLTEASEIEMRQSALLCQAYTNSNPFGRVDKIWRFKDGQLSVKVSLTFLRDMEVYSAMFGMMCVYRHWNKDPQAPYLTDFAIKDNCPGVIYNTKDNWESDKSNSVFKADNDCRMIIQGGELGWLFALVYDDGNRKPNGGMLVRTNRNPYNKIYSDLTGRYSARKDEVLWSEVHWVIKKTDREYDVNPKSWTV